MEDRKVCPFVFNCTNAKCKKSHPKWAYDGKFCGFYLTRGTCQEKDEDNCELNHETLENVKENSIIYLDWEEFKLQPKSEPTSPEKMNRR